MIACHLVLDLGLPSTDQARGLFVLLLGITSLAMLLPLFKMGCLVPGGARFIGTMGATMLIIANVFFCIVQTVPLFQPDWTVQRNELLKRYGEMFGIWFPLVAFLALLVLFFMVFLFRDKTFEQSPTAWYEGRTRRSEYWGKVVGWVVPLIQLVTLWLLDGTPDPNLYGPDPKGRTFVQFSGYAAAQPTQVDTAEPQQRLRRLQNLKNGGYISEAEYQIRRAQILSEI